MKEKHRRVRIMAKRLALKESRIQAGYNVPDLARLVSITKSMLYQVERGQVGVSDKTAYAICQRLGKGIGELFEFVWPDTEAMERTLEEGRQVSRRMELSNNH